MLMLYRLFSPGSEHEKRIDDVNRTGPKQYLDGDKAIVVHLLHPDESAKEAYDLSWSHAQFTNKKRVGASTTDHREYTLLSRGCLGVYSCS